MQRRVERRRVCVACRLPPFRMGPAPRETNETSRSLQLSSMVLGLSGPRTPGCCSAIPTPRKGHGTMGRQDDATPRQAPRLQSQLHRNVERGWDAAPERTCQDGERAHGADSCSAAQLELVDGGLCSRNSGRARAKRRKPRRWVHWAQSGAGPPAPPGRSRGRHTASQGVTGDTGAARCRPCRGAGPAAPHDEHASRGLRIEDRGSRNALAAGAPLSWLLTPLRGYAATASGPAKTVDM